MQSVSVTVNVTDEIVSLSLSEFFCAEWCGLVVTGAETAAAAYPMLTRAKIGFGQKSICA